MPLLHLIIIALIQGITEFLPISSSGHLILIPELTDWDDQGVLIDLAVHVGTLVAVMVYFRREVAALSISAAAFFRFPPARHRLNTPFQRRLFAMLLLASVPVIVAGLVLSLLDWTDRLRSAEVVGWASFGFGLLLYGVDRSAARDRTIDAIGFRSAWLIGCAQALALIPGTSRAGITMTAARALGITRLDAARFSMLLSIPTILAAGTLAAVDIVARGQAGLISDALGAAVLSCLAALASIHFLMRWLTHASMTIFVVYRCVLGLVLLGWAYL